MVLMVGMMGTTAMAADPIPLFQGGDLSKWQSVNGSAAPWELADDYVEVVPGTGDIRTIDTYTDFEVHLEFRVPLMPFSHGQERGNSGVYLQGRYEVQILDSYNNDTYANGACGSLYGQIAPMTNASLPPETWQTYDITFHAPRVDEHGNVNEAGHLTVVLNGITVIDDGRFSTPTGGALDDRIGEPGPLRLQDHGNHLRFRNIWIRPL
jgi:hypothetical protein